MGLSDETSDAVAVAPVADVPTPDTEFPNAVLIDMGDAKPEASDVYAGWDDFARLLDAVELANPDRRLVRVWHRTPRGEMYVGKFGSAPIEIGAAAYQWDNSEIVEA